MASTGAVARLTVPHEGIEIAQAFIRPGDDQYLGAGVRLLQRHIFRQGGKQSVHIPDQTKGDIPGLGDDPVRATLILQMSKNDHVAAVGVCRR